MSSIRLIVSDLDGTLLSEDHRLTEQVKEAVDRFVRAGGMFTIATGRFGPAAQFVVDELDISIPYILCNGSVIAERGQIREEAILSLGGLSSFLQEADRDGLTVMLFRQDGVDVLRRTEEAIRFEVRESVECRPIDVTSEAWTRANVQKVLLIGDMARIYELWNKQPSATRDSYATIQSEDHFFEIIPLHQSKGEALKKLMRMLDVQPDEVMALGNQLNDLDMIVHAGIGVAVANSHPELFAHADYVCSRSNGDGVIEAMEKFCGIQLSAKT